MKTNLIGRPSCRLLATAVLALSLVSISNIACAGSGSDPLVKAQSQVVLPDIVQIKATADNGLIATGFEFQENMLMVSTTISDIESTGILLLANKFSIPATSDLLGAITAIKTNTGIVYAIPLFATATCWFSGFANTGVGENSPPATLIASSNHGTGSLSPPANLIREI
ncbi:MAG: hypothetical protein WCF92_00035 [bacterium]